MKWIVITLLAEILSGMAAPGPEKQPSSQGNRYLFVVETSKAMSRLPHAGRQTVFDLVFSGLENRMRPGDTFGIWTFQEEVSAGVFPIQVWEPENKLELASRVGKFLKEQKYKGKPVLDNALARVGALSRSIKDVNVIIVCSTEAQPKEGRPFVQMASLWQQKAADSRKAKKPMVLTIAMERGELVHRSIAVGGDSLELPMPRPQLAVTNTPAASAATNLQARATRPNIIMQGPVRPRRDAAETVAITDADAPMANETNTTAVAQVAPTPPPGSPSREDSANAESVRRVTSTLTIPAVTTVPPDRLAAETKQSSTLLPAPIPVAAREKSAIAASQQVPPVTSATLSPTALILAGSGLMAVGLTVGAWLLISSRKGPQLSSISQSMSRIEQRRGV